MKKLALLSAILFISGNSFAREKDICEFFSQPKKAKVLECKYYNAAKDKAFRAKVEDYYSNAYLAYDKSKIDDFKGYIIQKNSGALIDVEVTENGAPHNEKLFFSTDDENVCDLFEKQASYCMNIEQLCPVLQFQTPENLGITATISNSSPKGFADAECVDMKNQ